MRNPPFYKETKMSANLESPTTEAVVDAVKTVVIVATIMYATAGIAKVINKATWGTLEHRRTMKALNKEA